jgi:carbon storage regulator CsrA
MLVLSRKKTETIVLPTLGITIDVLAITGNRVRIGIQAPSDVLVLRQEVAERISAGQAVGRSDPYASSGYGNTIVNSRSRRTASSCQR